MDKKYCRRKSVSDPGGGRDAVLGPGEDSLGNITLPPGCVYLYRGEHYSLATADPASDIALRLMDLAPDVAWSSSPELAEHAAEILSRESIRCLHLRIRPESGDTSTLAGSLERRNVVLVERTATSPSAKDDYLPEEDSDAVVKRLKDLGYM